MQLTVFICTHNRSVLLRRVLASINAARRPEGTRIELLVVANACTDDTVQVLQDYVARQATTGELPLRWTEERVPGKSFALNRGIPMIERGLVALVDDDHRVDANYLAAMVDAAERHPGVGMYCGRILPDWDGSEPKWVHDTGPYRIYPLPIPRYDEGSGTRPITLAGPLPGGGNLCVRREVFARNGDFSTELGPRGHDLGGGEDSDFVRRCLTNGEAIQYVPQMVQYHYADPERLQFGYLLRKSFQRSGTGIRINPAPDAGVPLYIWRKMATYSVLALFSFSWPRTRFYLMRLAATLGEMRGFVDTARHRAHHAGLRAGFGANLAAPANLLAAVLVLGGFSLLAAAGLGPSTWGPALLVAGVCAAALFGKSFYDFSQTGPPLKQEILRHYRLYSMVALSRLGLWAFGLCIAMAAPGVVVYEALSALRSKETDFLAAAAWGLAGIASLTVLQFCTHLLHVPGSIAASYHYRISRLYPVWRRLTRQRLAVARALLGGTGAAILSAAAWKLADSGMLTAASGFLLLSLAAVLGATGAPFQVAARAIRRAPGKRPNIVMIGSDTLRADRVGATGYQRSLTPFIDSLARHGMQFSACYVPCARTAPSLLSLLTGTWPHHHGIRDNFIGDDDTRLAVRGLPHLLAEAGYRTAAVSDWSGSDFGKFPLGFQTLDLPEDQWNIKYLIRQGPKDLRLFLSLFTRNRFGKRFLPELYYLAGVPLTSLVGRDARHMVSQLAREEAPFFLNVFASTTHPPFGSEYPYYTMWSDPAYAGESKFVMARLTDPWDIIRRQGDSRKDFDLEQIIDLYDGCVRSFDDEARKIVDHLQHCGLLENTIVVLYSDHGMEFFEHDTWGQGNSVRGDSSARIPLVFAGPGIRAGSPYRHTVRSIDIAPTLLELAGVPVPAGMDGASLARHLQGDAGDAAQPAFNETGIWLTDVPGMPADHVRYPNLLELLEVPDRRSGTLALKPEYRQLVVRAKDRMVRHGPWKLTYQPTKTGARYALFNVEEDPDCRQDVSSQHRDKVRELQALLANWMQQDSGLQPAEAEIRPGSAPAAAASAVA